MDFQALNKILEVESNRISNNPITDLNRVMDKISQDFSLSNFIDSLISNQNYLNLIASESYNHEIGFDKIVLSPYQGRAFQLRYNIWWEGGQTDECHYEDVHNHRWNFTTMLLAGKYKYENFEMHLKGEQYMHYKYFPLKNGNYFFDYQGDIKIKLISSGTLDKGCSMSVKSNVFHRIIPIPVKTTFTFFLNTLPKKNYSDVFRKEKVEQVNGELITSYMSSNEIIDKLKRLLTAI